MVQPTNDRSRNSGRQRAAPECETVTQCKATVEQREVPAGPVPRAPEMDMLISV